MSYFKTILVLVIVMLLPIYGFAQGIAVGPEFPVNPNGSNNPRGTSVAWSGKEFMVVWEDANCLGDTQSAIFGVRIDSLGNLMDTRVIPISVDSLNVDSLNRGCPQISLGKSKYLVVWEKSHLPSTLYSGCGVYAARMDISGEVLDPNGILISSGSYTNPSVCWDGTKWFVVWHNDIAGNGNDIFGTWVDTLGVVLNPEGIVISASSTANQAYPKVCWGGNKYFVTWNDDRLHPPYQTDIFGARVESNGNVLDPEGICLVSDYGYQWYSSVASSGKQYFAVWTDLKGYYNDVYGARVDTSGEVLDNPSVPICTDTIHQSANGLCWDNTNYLVVWQDNRDGEWDIYGARVNPSGSVLDVQGVPISNLSVPEVSATSAHSKGKRNLVLYQRAEPNGIYGRIVIDESSYLEGDASGDGLIDIADVVYLTNYLFKNGAKPSHLNSADVNADCKIDLADVVHLINYLYKNGPAPQMGCVE